METRLKTSLPIYIFEWYIKLGVAILFFVSSQISKTKQEACRYIIICLMNCYLFLCLKKG